MASPHHHHHQLHRFPSSSSSSSPPGSYYSNSSSIVQPQPPQATTNFEQVWNDITHSTPHHQNHHPTTTIPHNIPPNSPSSMTFQDFLALAPPCTTVSPSNAGIFLHPSATILTLKSSADYQLPISKSIVTSSTPPATNSASSNSTPSPLAFSDNVASAASLGFFPFAGNILPADIPQPDGPTAATGDRHRRRMMKNRESAARSRARKQAYANELEVAVNNLTQENAKLRRMHDELRAAMAAQLPTKKTLLRTMTAPF